MLHICDVNNFYSSSGGGVRTYHTHKLEYFRSTQRARYTLFVPSDRDAIEHDADGITRIHLPATPIPGAAHYRYIAHPGPLRAHLKRLQPDIIEVGSPYIAPWVVRAAARGLRTRVVGFWHADYPRAYFKRYVGQVHPLLGDAAHAIGWWYARQTYGHYDATLAAADCVVSELWERGIPRVFQTPLGVDTERFHPRHRDEALRASVGASDPDRPVLFFPHRLIEEKGLSNLLAAFPRIHAAHKPVLVFAGVGPGKPKLDAFLAQQADTHYLGYIDDPALMGRWYASADAVFALSAFETFGLSAAEAMASGNALIAADEGAAAELVHKSGGGALVPYNDTDALVQATNALLASGQLRAKGQAARDFAARHFSWTAAFDRFMTCYEAIAAADPSNPLPDAPRRWEPEAP